MHPSSQCENDRQSRLLNAMPAIAWSANAQTFRFTYVNPAAETLLGYPVKRWIEEPDFWMRRLHPEDGHVALLCHNETLAGRDHELIYRMIAADGREVWLRDYVNVHMVDGVPTETPGHVVAAILTFAATGLGLVSLSRRMSADPRWLDRIFTGQ